MLDLDCYRTIQDLGQEQTCGSCKQERRFHIDLYCHLCDFMCPDLKAAELHYETCILLFYFLCFKNDCLGSDKHRPCIQRSWIALLLEKMAERLQR